MGWDDGLNSWLSGRSSGKPLTLRRTLGGEHRCNPVLLSPMRHTNYTGVHVRQESYYRPFLLCHGRRPTAPFFLAVRPALIWAGWLDPSGGSPALTIVFSWRLSLVDVFCSSRL